MEIELRRLQYRYSLSFILILVLFFFCTIPDFAQNKDQTKQKFPAAYEKYDESPGDAYIPVQKSKQKRSQAFKISSTDFFAVQVNVDEFGQNIVGDAANEPSIIIDPANPNNISIGWRQFDTISSNFRQAGYAFSTDAGQSWTFPGCIEPGIFRSDPVLGANNSSNLFYYSLSTSGSYTCELFNSTDGGANWMGFVPAYGGDKGWMTIDRTGSIGDGHIYCFSRNDVSTSIVMTRSVDGGNFFQPLVNVPTNPGRGTIAVGYDGIVYTAGRSFNNGEFSFARSTNSRDSSATPVFEYSTQLDLGGQYSAYAGPNPGGLLGQTIVAGDAFGISGDSTVYVLSSVDPPGADPLDVYFIRSTNCGNTWSLPIRINDDPVTNAWQWFGTMSVAPNGRIDVIWLDTRDNPGTYLSSLYYSYSLDFGITWSQNERLSEEFDPHLGWPQQNKMGDYFDMLSDNDGASIAWAGTFNGEEDVYFGRIIHTPVLVDDDTETNLVTSFKLDQNYPNPFNPSTKIRFVIPNEVRNQKNLSSQASRNDNTLVTLKVYDVLGNEVATLVDEYKSAGIYEIDFDADKIGSGIYFYQLQAGSPSTGSGQRFVETKKMILLK